MSLQQRYQDYAQAYADRVAKLLEAGTAPWIRPWKAGQIEPGFGMPYNPISGKGYSGSNLVLLHSHQIEAGYDDNRWLTFPQIQRLGLRLRKGSSQVRCIKWIDPLNKDQKREEEPDRHKRLIPKGFGVFNGALVEGMPALPVREPPKEPERHAQCEALIAASKADIEHDGGNRAFYRPMTDDIHLPLREAFKSPDAYYATVLHELGHWTGHPTRLGRDLTGGFGSEQYAKEELRAELASMMIGERLGIGHDPGQHAAYIASWVKILKEHPKEILTAAKDADRICDHLGVHKYEHEPMATKERDQAAEQVRKTPEPRRPRARQRTRELVMAMG